MQKMQETFDDSMARVAGLIRGMAKREQPPPALWIGKVVSAAPAVVQMGTFSLSQADGSLILSHSICVSCPNLKESVCPRFLRAGDRAILISLDQQTYYMVGKF